MDSRKEEILIRARVRGRCCATPRNWKPWAVSRYATPTAGILICHRVFDYLLTNHQDLLCPVEEEDTKPKVATATVCVGTVMVVMLVLLESVRLPQ